MGLKVTVTAIPGDTIVMECNAGEQVREVLSRVGINKTDDLDVQINGSDADLSTPIQDGDDVLAAKRTKGNLDKVTITKVPGDPITIQIPSYSDIVVSEAAELAGLSRESIAGMMVTINGDSANLGDSAEGGDDIVFTANTKGNN